MGLHVELLYANVGDVGNPQPKIIGVKYIYTRRDVSYQVSLCHILVMFFSKQAL